MSEIPNISPSWFARTISNPSCRKGLASALAGLLVAAISESLWPSEG
jgi:hypothetical protein